LELHSFPSLKCEASQLLSMNVFPFTLTYFNDIFGFQRICFVFIWWHLFSCILWSMLLNQINFILFLAHSLLLYRNTVDFYILTICPEVLLNLPVLMVFSGYGGIFLYTRKGQLQIEMFYVFHSNLDVFPYVIILVRTFNTMWLEVPRMNICVLFLIVKRENTAFIITYDIRGSLVDVIWQVEEVSFYSLFVKCSLKILTEGWSHSSSSRVPA
jgi:hypothetical protein